MAKHRNRNGKASIVLYFLIGLSATATAVCSFGLVRELYTRRQGQSFYAALPVASKRQPQTAADARALPGGEGLMPAESEQVWIPYLDFDALRHAIPDLTAWIRCEGTVIDYPVVLGTDNAYYLNHLADGKVNKMGSIFLDYRNQPDFTDKNSVIYGHHMNSGDMFGSLEYYKEQSFYDEHPVIELYTPENDYAVEVFAGCVISGDLDSLPLNFEDEVGFESYLAELRRQSVFVSGVDVSAEDRLVTLCTCAYNFSNARFLVVGKLTPLFYQ